MEHTFNIKQIYINKDGGRFKYPGVFDFILRLNRPTCDKFPLADKKKTKQKENKITLMVSLQIQRCGKYVYFESKIKSYLKHHRLNFHSPQKS